MDEMNRRDKVESTESKATSITYEATTISNVTPFASNNTVPTQTQITKTIFAWT